MSSIFFIALLFFLIALLYSSVGFGGGSSYIALLLLLGSGIEEIRFTALICNVIVVAAASINYHRAGTIPWLKVLPIFIFSIPLAYWGGTIVIELGNYKLIAAIALILAAGLMILDHQRIRKEITINSLGLSSMGGGIGLLSGIIGIGGGIFLAPVLHLFRWQSAKIISATASVFILLNSLAGIAGQMSTGPQLQWNKILILGLSVFIGGQIGNYLNLRVLSEKRIRIATAVLIAFVGFRILFTQLN